MFDVVGNRCIAKYIEDETAKKQPVILTLAEPKKKNRAQVLAIGQGIPDKNGVTPKSPVNEGDIILISKQTWAEEFSFQDEDYLNVSWDQIICVVK